MLSVVYCRCGSSDVLVGARREDGTQRWFCTECEAEGTISGLNVGVYFGAHTSDVRNKSAPDRKWTHSEVQEWERYRREDAPGEPSERISPEESVRPVIFSSVKEILAHSPDPVREYEVSEAAISTGDVDGLAALL